MMAVSGRGGGDDPFGEGVHLVFGRWTALQMAVENLWGGRGSKAKADQLGASILSWFGYSKGPHYFKDLVDMMYDTISKSFNADFEDGSVEEVAEKLLIMHEECQQGNYSSIEELRKSPGNAFSQSRQLPDAGNDDSDDSDDDDDGGMAVDADGWRVVPPRRGCGKD